MADLQKIIWAIDPFEHKGLEYENTVKTLRCVQRRMNAVILPVHILNPAELSFAGDLTGQITFELDEKYRTSAELAVNSYLKNIELSGPVEPPKILIQATGSKREAVGVLDHYAESQGASLILVSTHSKEGLKRIFIGSFAEAVALHSRYPALVVRSVTDSFEECFERVLFPTDLTQISKVLFKNTVSLAKVFGAKITLFHSVPNPVEPVLQSGMYLLGGSWVPVHNYFSVDIEERKRKIEAWCSWASKQGVEIETVVSERGGSITDSILRLAREKNAQMIVMAAESGPISAALLGSIAREVLRRAHCPTLILHPLKRVRKSTMSKVA